MPASPASGDVLIRLYTGSSYQLVDAMTREQIAIIRDLPMAVRIGSDHGGAVWRENVDNRGRPLGSPVLLLPRSSVGHR
jgi:hypothetical protein